MNDGVLIQGSGRTMYRAATQIIAYHLPLQRSSWVLSSGSNPHSFVTVVRLSFTIHHCSRFETDVWYTLKHPGPGCSLQVSTTNENILYEGCSAVDYAEKTWRSLTSNAIMTPLEGLVAVHELQQLKPLFVHEVVEMAESWQSSEGLRNPYVMLWCSAARS